MRIHCVGNRAGRQAGRQNNPVCATLVHVCLGCAGTVKWMQATQRHTRPSGTHAHIFHKLLLQYMILYSFCKFRYHCNIEQVNPFFGGSRVLSAHTANTHTYCIFCSVFSISRNRIGHCKPWTTKHARDAHIEKMILQSIGCDSRYRWAAGNGNEARCRQRDVTLVRLMWNSNRTILVV